MDAGASPAFAMTVRPQVHAFSASDVFDMVEEEHRRISALRSSGP